MRSALTLLTVSLLSAIPAAAIETDQFYAWGRELADSTEMINARHKTFNFFVANHCGLDCTAPVPTGLLLRPLRVTATVR